MRTPDEPAQLASLATLRRIAIVMFGGAIFGLLCAIGGPDPDRADHAALAVIIGLEALCVTVLVAVRRPTRDLMRFAALWGIGTTLGCVAVARPTNGVPLYVVWPLLLAAY